VRGRSPLRWIWRIGLLAILGVLVWFGVTGYRIWTVGHEDRHPRSDAIIVLGASELNGRPSALLEARLAHALALYRAHVAPVVVTVGGNRPGDRYTEGGVGADWLREHGVPAAATLPIGEGRDTLQSLQAAAAALRSHGWHTAVLVTDPWHCLRSRTMARNSGSDATTSPTRTGPSVSSRGTELRYIARETLAYTYYEVVP
jgi:uncharacterized SAM-binding protein YcdF (DUF218 family)